ncbi:UvrD-helicase domain-containing protein [Flavobacterium sp. 102]|uniref:UvrD-helicase domain-containing protein n=1 Tax=Flavobacterium sp. 102 TaxID=2135623 RepID=UPI000EB51C3F|nr:UvrD-helicase domain-containing protein [Flavobacterium sp. 102]RKS03025.1 DNA helicase-2/ATP-dependent DNA helicase PcrA [Flavobacterium sp. 102]
MAIKKVSGELIIAGPGAGKTYNMVESIIEALQDLSSSRYLVVITYTNSATNNIYSRLSKRITIPENLFIGTMHSFLNRFIIIPFSSYGAEEIGREKLFMQCGLDDVFKKVEKMKEKDKRSNTNQASAIIKSNIKKRLNKLGYITYDQTLSISKECMSKNSISRIISNRLQYLFIDEFQDTGNEVFSIIENIRKVNKTKIYCVGDPEQYIQSFDSSIREFKYIPILKASESNSYNININDKNYRSTTKIVGFLNHFNGRNFKNLKFEQKAVSKNPDSVTELDTDEEIVFITQWETVTPIIEKFYSKCESISISISNRCILAKKNDVIKRVKSSVNNQYMDPKKNSIVLPINVIQDTLLSTLQMNQTQFCTKYETNIFTLRKHAVAIFKAINSGVITNENTFGLFVKNVLKLEMKEGLPVKIENLKFDFNNKEVGNYVTVSNIHTIKGLESEAVLAIAKTEEELLLWIETDHSIRESKRDNEKTDYPRLGYVAFSRAERLLCIACLEKISETTITKLDSLGVVLMS